jgi:hypothetical protein
VDTRGAGGAVHRAVGGVGGRRCTPSRAWRRRQSLMPLHTTSSCLLRELLAPAGAPRTGSSTPLRADIRSRGSGSGQTGTPSRDIPRCPGPPRGSRDSARCVAEASTRCRGAGGSPPARALPALRSSSTRSGPPCRPRVQFGSDIPSHGCAPCAFSLPGIRLGVRTTLLPRARGAASPRPVAGRPPYRGPGCGFPGSGSIGVTTSRRADGRPAMPPRPSRVTRPGHPRSRRRRPSSPGVGCFGRAPRSQKSESEGSLPGESLGDLLIT